MTALSINVNKFALIRNARGADMPNLVDISKKCIEYGAEGITVHPRPDERHVKFSDLQKLKKLTDNYEKIEFNIEGYPSDDFINRVIDVLPDQVTLEVIEADAVVKGQTASSSYKPALLENGIKTLVPPHIETGTFIVISTVDGSYIERAKD